MCSILEMSNIKTPMKRMFMIMSAPLSSDEEGGLADGFKALIKNDLTKATGTGFKGHRRSN